MIVTISSERFDFRVDIDKKKISELIDFIMEEFSEEKDKYPVKIKPDPVSTSQSKEPFYKNGRTGLVMTVCPNCGDVHGFFAKAPAMEDVCRACGNVMRLDVPMKKAYVNCYCGRSCYYRTNATRDIFKATCYDCGNQIDIIYDKNDDCYKSYKGD